MLALLSVKESNRTRAHRRTHILPGRITPFQLCWKRHQNDVSTFSRSEANVKEVKFQQLDLENESQCVTFDGVTPTAKPVKIILLCSSVMEQLKSTIWLIFLSCHAICHTPEMTLLDPTVCFRRLFAEDDRTYCTGGKLKCSFKNICNRPV